MKMNRSLLLKCSFLCLFLGTVLAEEINDVVGVPFLKFTKELTNPDVDAVIDRNEENVISAEDVDDDDLTSENDTEFGYSDKTCADFMSVELGKSWFAYCKERNRECLVTGRRSPTSCGSCIAGTKGEVNPSSFCKGPCQNIKLTPGGKSIYDWDTPENYCTTKSTDCVVRGEYDFYCRCWKSSEVFSKALEKCVERITCSDLRMDHESWDEYCEKKNQVCTVAEDQVDPLCGGCMSGFRWNQARGVCEAEFKEPCKLSTLTPGGRSWQTPQEYCAQRNSDCLNVGNFDFACRCWNKAQSFSKIQEQCIEESLDACRNRLLTPGGRASQTPESYCAQRNADCFSRGSSDFTCRCRQNEQVFSKSMEQCIGCLGKESEQTAKEEPVAACYNEKLTPFGRAWQMPNQYCNERRANCVAQGNTNFYCVCFADDTVFSPKNEACVGRK